MARLLFACLHLIAIGTGGPLLFVTIPAHLIYAAIVRGNEKPETSDTSRTHLKCPDCRELVLRDASICKHCHAKLIPQTALPEPAPFWRAKLW